MRCKPLQVQVLRPPLALALSANAIKNDRRISVPCAEM